MKLLRPAIKLDIIVPRKQLSSQDTDYSRGKMNKKKNLKRKCFLYEAIAWEQNNLKVVNIF